MASMRTISKAFSEETQRAVMTEIGIEQHTVTTETIQQLADVLTLFMSQQINLSIKGLYDALYPVLIDIRATVQAFQVMPVTAIEQSITHAVRAAIPSPTMQELPENNLQQLERIEELLMLLSGNFPQLQHTMALLTQQKAGNTQQIESQLATIVE